MSFADTLDSLPNGAQFYRADLHIHSFRGSHDVSDTSMTPEAIVDTALSEQLSLIAITDHNEITNIDHALAAADGRRLVVIPGVELSTPEGHLLAYFQDPNSLRHFCGRLDIVGKGTNDSRCQTSMLQCLKLIDPTKGFAILAHIDGPGGFEEKVPGAPPHKADIISQATLLGIELRSAKSDIAYSEHDPDSERKKLGRQRRQDLGAGAQNVLARTLFSDSHTLAALGKNLQGQKRITRFKMDSPSFTGLRLALEEADARVRLEDEVPQAVPYVKGLALKGGFLDGAAVRFSSNLNCIIGGRGAGKSTIFEAIRCAASLDSPSKLVDCEVWPHTINLAWMDGAQQQHNIVRRSYEKAQNVDDSDFGPVVFPLECYGQGETAQTSQKAQTDPAALLGYLDQFVDLGALPGEQETIRDQLLENQNDIEKARMQVDSIPQYERALSTTRSQLKTLEKAKAKDVVELERKVAEERKFRVEILDILGRLDDQTHRETLKSCLETLRTLCDVDRLRVGAQQYRAILSAVDNFEQSISQPQKAITANTAKLSETVTAATAKWQSQENATLQKIEQKRNELAAQGVTLDLQFIRKLAADEANYTRTLATLKKWRVHLGQLQRTRKEHLKHYRGIREQIANARQAYAAQASDALKGTLGDLFVTIKLKRDSFSPEAEDIIQGIMGWKTVQVPRARLLSELLTVPALLETLQRNNTLAITQLQAADGSRPFSLSDARELIERLKRPAERFRLERCQVEDLPQITVTKNVSKQGERARYVSRDFSRLSLGQQQSVLLALMLSSKSSAPLIIDQPEDNLDAEFIYHSLVPVLRRAKERRQVIIVTHNANIAVLGDVEQIIALKSVSDHSSILARGSIDHDKARAMACRILEGSDDAFRRRAKIYGLRLN